MRKLKKDMYDTLSLEVKLVLICSSLEITIKEQRVITNLLARYINWELVVRLAVHHRVYPLVYRCLSNQAHSVVPSEILSVLRQWSRASATKALQMTGKLVEILSALEQEGVRVVVLKGLPLAQRLYGDVTLRPSRDLDILVWPEDVEKAGQIIQKQGYHLTEPNCELTPVLLGNLIKTNHHMGYWHKESEIFLELHWQLGNHGTEIPLIQIEGCLTEVKLAGKTVQTLGMEMQLLYLILHGANHGWSRLRWLCDIGAILRPENFAWEKLYNLAVGLEVEPLVNQAVILIHTMFAAPVPANILEVATKDNKGKKLAFMALPFITSATYVPGNLKDHLRLYYHKKKYDLTLLSGWKKKKSYLFIFFVTAESKIGAVVLPNYLYFVHYLLRPFGWIYRRIGDLTGR